MKAFRLLGTTRRSALLLLALITSAAVVSSQPAAAQSYPSRTVTLVVTVPAGGSIDAVARLLAVNLTKALGQNVIVESRPGAGGNLAAGYVASAAPDGHTLLIGNSATLTTNPHIYKSVPFELGEKLRRDHHSSAGQPDPGDQPEGAGHEPAGVRRLDEGAAG